MSRNRVYRFLFALVGPVVLSAHDPTEEQIERISILIRKTPRNAELYFRRAELERARREWKAALGDYGTALRLKPALDVALLGQALVRFSAGHDEEACRAFDGFLARVPGHPDALLGRARCRDRLGRTAESAKDYSELIHRVREPRPEYFLERAVVLARAGLKDEALASLDEGIGTLGPLVTLQLEAIALDLELERYGDAVARLTYFVDTSVRKETWLARRADVYQRMGRQAEARSDRDAAIVAIAALPNGRQNDRATVDLLRSLKDKTQ